MHVYECTKRAHKHKYVQIIPVLLHPYQQGLFLFVNGVMNSLHIKCINKLGHSHIRKFILSPMQVLSGDKLTSTFIDFLWPVSNVGNYL